VREEDREGRSLPGSGTTTIAPVDGGDVVLTIDRSVQFAVEQALRDAFGKYKDRTVFVDVITDQTENVWPMVQGGKGLTEMLLGSEDL
jgi:acetolactate synthase-1/2/3 large subunit